MRPIDILRMRNAAVAAPTAHAYWRLYITATTSQENVSDLQFRATVGGADQVPVLTSLTAEVVYSSFSAGGSPFQVFDSDPTGTFWNDSIAVLPMWVGYHFSSAVDVAQVSITVSTAGITAFKIQYSDNGSAWTDRATFTGQSFTAGIAQTFNTP